MTFRRWLVRVRLPLVIGATLLAARAQGSATGGAAGSSLIGTCQACHRHAGISEAADMPNLAGQKLNYLVRQLEAFRSGERKDAQMAAIAGQLRGAPAMARLAGFAAAGDGHHWTEPCSAGQVRAMKGALDDAGLSARDIGYVNAYGSGTLIGDRVEAGSIATVFGSGSTAPWVSSTKATHGHLLGASGAIELAASVATLVSGKVPPTRNLREPDAACAASLVREDTAALPAGSAVLSNSSAFGGSNACLVVAAA